MTRNMIWFTLIIIGTIAYLHTAAPCCAAQSSMNSPDRELLCHLPYFLLSS